MKKNGFTLVELIAVIIILSVLVLLVAPVVIDLIDDSEEKTAIMQAKFYLEAVELSIYNLELENKYVTDGSYKIMPNGNLCLGSITKNTCNGEVIKIQDEGKAPDSGTIEIKASEIGTVNLIIDEKIIEKKGMNGNLVYVGNSFVNEYELGEYVKFNPGDTERTWNVIGETEKTVTLLLSENLIENIAWNSERSFDNGPITALEALNKFTSDNNWDGKLIIGDYTYINTDRVNDSVSGYQKLEIQNGIAKLTSKDGETITQINGTTKARILSVSEVLEISGRINPNLSADSLDTFLNENVEELKTLTGSSFNSAKEISEENWGLYNHELAFLYAVNLVSEIESLSSYDLSFPSWILTTDDGYWTLTSLYYEGNSAWFVAPGYVVPYYVDYAGNGIRPVITIEKEGSNIIKIN